MSGWPRRASSASFQGADIAVVALSEGDDIIS